VSFALTTVAFETSGSNGDEFGAMSVSISSRLLERVGWVTSCYSGRVYKTGFEDTPTHQTLSRHSDCISYCSCSHQLPSRLYCNSVLYGAPRYVTHKLQRVHNSRQKCSPVRQSSQLRTSSTATSLTTCSQQNTFQTCHNYI